MLYSLAQDENTLQDGFEVWDASVRLIDQAKQWETTLYVKNVFNEWHVTGIGPTVSQFLPNGYLQSVPKYAKRTSGMEFRYRW